MACPILKTVTVTFIPPAPAPSGGYRVKWRVKGTSSYTTATGPFTSSPIVLTNIPACEDIEGTIENDCGGSYSNPVAFSASKVATMVCGTTVSRSNTSTQSYIYPKELIDLSGTTSPTIYLNWSVGDIPNRIAVYNSENFQVANTGWKGSANYPGPWGSTLQTANTGTLDFQKASGDGRFFYILADNAGHPTLGDNWQATLSCVASGGNNDSGGTTKVPTSISITDGSVRSESFSCLNDTYSRAIHRTVVTVLDQTGQPINTPSAITVVVKYANTYVNSSPTDTNEAIIVSAGSSSNYYEYTRTDFADDGQSSSCSPETKIFSCVVSKSTSLPYNGQVTTC
jgi:hypothetical protein